MSNNADPTDPRFWGLPATAPDPDDRRLWAEGLMEPDPIEAWLDAETAREAAEMSPDQLARAILAPWPDSAPYRAAWLKLPEEVQRQAVERRLAVDSAPQRPPAEEPADPMEEPVTGSRSSEGDFVDLENVDEDGEWTEDEYHGACPICDAPVYESAEDAGIQPTCPHLLAMYQRWPHDIVPDNLAGINVPWENAKGLEGWGQPIYQQLNQIQAFFAALCNKDNRDVEQARGAWLNRMEPHSKGGWLDDALHNENPLRITTCIVEMAIEETPAIKTSAGGENWGMNSAAAPYYLWAEDPRSARQDLSGRLDSAAAETARIAGLFRIELALTDDLTKLPNRRALEQCLVQETEWARSHDSSIAFLLVDLDHLKEVNDTYGHLNGDAVLAELAAILITAVRVESDFCARYGGDEFALILRDTTEEAARTLAEGIRTKVALKTFPGGVSLTISVGVAAIDEPALFRHLIHRAEQALYAAKARGGNQVWVGDIQEPSTSLHGAKLLTGIPAPPKHDPEAEARQFRLIDAALKLRDDSQGSNESHPGATIASAAEPENRSRDIGEDFAASGKEFLTALMREKVKGLTSEMLPRFNRQYARLWEEASDAQRARLVELLTQLMMSATDATTTLIEYQNFKEWMDGNTTGPVPGFVRDALSE